MNVMGISKVSLNNGETLIDLTNDTITADKLASGYTAHGADGEQIIGTAASYDETIRSITKTLTSGVRYKSITFNGLLGEPREWYISSDNFEFATGSRYCYITNGSSISGNNCGIISASSSSVEYSIENISISYSNGNITFTVSGASNYFDPGGTYTLYYKI